MAEVRLFRRFREELSDDWTVLHSAGLTGHATKRWAEVDFVLVGPPGIFCIEIKGGRVRRVNGVWHFIKRSGEVNERWEGPFHQAGGAEAALRSYLKSRQLDRTPDGRVIMGWGVAFPDIKFTITGPDIERGVVLDASDDGQSLAVYVQRLAAYWHARLSPLVGKIAMLRRDDIGAIVEAIRGDFDLRPSLRTQAGEAASQLVRLTREQIRVLDGLQDAKRVIIKGSAGTGKALLAVEECRRLAVCGERVLLTCHSPALATWLSTVLRDARVDVYALHALAQNLVWRAGRTGDLPDADPGYI